MRWILTTLWCLVSTRIHTPTTYSVQARISHTPHLSTSNPTIIIWLSLPIRINRQQTLLYTATKKNVCRSKRATVSASIPLSFLFSSSSHYLFLYPKSMIMHSLCLWQSSWSSIVHAWDFCYWLHCLHIIGRGCPGISFIYWSKGITPNRYLFSIPHKRYDRLKNSLRSSHPFSCSRPTRTSQLKEHPKSITRIIITIPLINESRLLQ